MKLLDDLERDRRSSRANYSASFMSNAKWKTLLAAIEKSNLKVKQVVVKFIDDNEQRPMQMPAWRGQAFADSIEYGPFPFVAIEWLEFPRIATLPRGDNVPHRQEQDIDAIRGVLDDTGKAFPLEDTPTGLRVIGHIR